MMQPLRWVAMGNSLTVGHGTSPGESYPERVAQLSLSSVTPLALVKNLAVSGHTLAKLQLMQLPQAAEYRPDVVSLWTGTNDALLFPVTGKARDILSGEPLPTSPENFERRLNAVFETLSAMKVAHVFIGKIHDLWRLPIAEGWDEERIDLVQTCARRYNEIIARTAGKFSNATVAPLDPLPELADPGNYMRDGIHPRPQAYAPIAAAWWRTMHPKLQP